MITKNEITAIGSFQRTHALKGELNAMLDIDADFLFTPDVPLIVEIDGIYVPFFAESVRPKGHFSSLVKLKGVDDVEEAKKFVNKEIYALSADLHHWAKENDDNDSDDVYANELIGYRLYDGDAEVGEIIEVDDSTPGNPLFVVKDGEREIMVPIAEEMITDIDYDHKILKMNLPEGLVNLN